MRLSSGFGLVADEMRCSHRARSASLLPSDTGNLSHMTFFSSSPDVSPKDHGMDSSIRDYRQDLEFLNISGGIGPPAPRHQLVTGVPNTQIAPWASEGSPNSGAIPSGSFFDDGRSRLPASPSFRPDTGRTGASDSPDPIFFGDERRPSMASATTVSSSNSNRRASTSRSTRRKKLANFFGEDESSRGSDPSIFTTGRDHSTSSHSHRDRDRNNSVHTINIDGRPISPSSSRPRTPLPSSDVTPWLFQDFKVSLWIRFGHTQSMHVCVNMCTLYPCLSWYLMGKWNELAFQRRRQTFK